MKNNINIINIPAGSFKRGEFTVTLSGFGISEAPITQAQYQEVMGTNPSYFKYADDAPLRPVERVSWYDAMAFCRRLTLRHRAEGILRANECYDLPTEAQWEYACRAGTAGDRYGELNEIAWTDENSGGETHAVKQLRPNAWGLFDMLGNVWEWCKDWYDQYPKEDLTDPTGPEQLGDLNVEPMIVDGVARFGVDHWDAAWAYGLKHDLVPDPAYDEFELVGFQMNKA